MYHLLSAPQQKFCKPVALAEHRGAGVYFVLISHSWTNKILRSVYCFSFSFLIISQEQNYLYMLCTLLGRFSHNPLNTSVKRTCCGRFLDETLRAQIPGDLFHQYLVSSRPSIQTQDSWTPKPLFLTVPLLNIWLSEHNHS